MKKILEFFEKYGIVKLFCSFLLLALFASLYNRTNNDIFNYLAFIPAAYIVIAFLLFFAAAIWNTIRDLRK